MTQKNAFNGLASVDEDDNLSLAFLSTKRERLPVPTIVEKVEFSIWAERGSRYQYLTMHELFGKPEFTPAENISSKVLYFELRRIENIMKKHGVIVTTYSDVSSRERYRFITTEVFSMLTTGKIVLKPMKIVYEEFHPTEAYLVKKAASDFLRALFGLEAWKYQWKLWKKRLTNYKEIKKFALNYEEFDVQSLEMDEIVIEGDTASVVFEVGFYGIENSGFVHQFKGDGSCTLTKNSNYWCVDHVTLPQQVRV